MLCHTLSEVIVTGDKIRIILNGSYIRLQRKKIIASTVADARYKLHYHMFS